MKMANLAIIATMTEMAKIELLAIFATIAKT
jgi:hypothetical protein